LQAEIWAKTTNHSSGFFAAAATAHGLGSLPSPFLGDGRALAAAHDAGVIRKLEYHAR
jgi:hypothetical protein